MYYCRCGAIAGRSGSRRRVAATYRVSRAPAVALSRCSLRARSEQKPAPLLQLMDDGGSSWTDWSSSPLTPHHKLSLVPRAREAVKASAGHRGTVRDARTSKPLHSKRRGGSTRRPALWFRSLASFVSPRRRGSCYRTAESGRARCEGSLEAYCAAYRVAARGPTTDPDPGDRACA